MAKEKIFNALCLLILLIISCCFFTHLRHLFLPSLVCICFLSFWIFHGKTGKRVTRSFSTGLILVAGVLKIIINEYTRIDLERFSAKTSFSEGFYEDQNSVGIVIVSNVDLYRQWKPAKNLFSKRKRIRKERKDEENKSE